MYCRKSNVSLLKCILFLLVEIYESTGFMDALTLPMTSGVRRKRKGSIGQKPGNTPTSPPTSKPSTMPSVSFLAFNTESKMHVDL